ncbi:unnamed protein product [Agarophyton chilense]
MASIAAYSCAPATVGAMLQRSRAYALSGVARRVWGARLCSRAPHDGVAGSVDGGGSADGGKSIGTTVKPCRLFDLRGAPVAYGDAWELQHALADGMKRDARVADALVLLEHQPVYTLGTASSTDHVLFDAHERRRGDMGEPEGRGELDAPPLLVRTERGGEVTYHGPGQLVAYPILNLTRHRKDLHWYLRALEGTVIDMLLRFYGIRASRKDGLSGVWVGDQKVCAVGLKVSKWITMHGLALNVCTDLQPFQRIVPCGVTQHGVSSLHLLVRDGRSVSVQVARSHLLDSFERTFGPYRMIRSTYNAAHTQRAKY